MPSVERGPRQEMQSIGKNDRLLAAGEWSGGIIGEVNFIICWR